MTGGKYRHSRDREAGMTNVDLRANYIERHSVEDGTIDWAISNCVINPDKHAERLWSQRSSVDAASRC